MVRDRFEQRLTLPSVAVIAGLIGAASPVLALGGSRTGADARLGSHLVMVLAREGQQHSACTGTIIARNVVLTAAHCVAGPREVVIAYPESGSHVLQRVNAKAIHPGFSRRSNVSIDLALIRLDRPLPQRFTPLPLDQGGSPHRVGLALTIAGFGMQHEGGDESAGRLRSGRVQVLPRLFPRFLRLGMTADAELSDLAICTGDSGGPVIDMSDGSPEVVGVIYGRERFGNARSCGTIAQAVRVAPQQRWIESVLARWSGRTAPRPTR